MRRARDQILDLDLDALRAQRLHDLVALPVAIGGPLQMLDGAAATGAEVATWRLDTLRRWFEDRQQVSAILVAGSRNRFSGKREGDENRAGLGLGDAVALRTQTRDGEAGGLSLIHI